VQNLHAFPFLKHFKNSTGSAIRKVNIADMFSRFTDHRSPKIVGELNGQQVKLVKFRGEFVWHSHARKDELFLAEQQGEVLLFEPASTLNTANTDNDFTRGFYTRKSGKDWTGSIPPERRLIEAMSIGGAAVNHILKSTPS
jgi:hypothetical protein